MPRPPRIDFPDALYHVTSRGNGRRPIFWTDADRERFLCQLAEALRTHGVLLYAFVEMDTHACILDDDGPILDALAASRYAVGSPRFVEETERRLAARRTGRPQDGDIALPRDTVEIERIDGAVAEHYGVAEGELSRRGPCAGAAKFVAVELACRLTGLTQRAIGTHYGGITSGGISNIRRRIREGDYPLADAVEELLRKLS